MWKLIKIESVFFTINSPIPAWKVPDSVSRSYTYSPLIDVSCNCIILFIQYGLLILSTIHNLYEDSIKSITILYPKHFIKQYIICALILLLVMYSLSFPKYPNKKYFLIFLLQFNISFDIFLFCFLYSDPMKQAFIFFIAPFFI